MYLNNNYGDVTHLNNLNKVISSSLKCQTRRSYNEFKKTCHSCSINNLDMTEGAEGYQEDFLLGDLFWLVFNTGTCWASHCQQQSGGPASPHWALLPLYTTSTDIHPTDIRISTYAGPSATPHSYQLNLKVAPTASPTKHGLRCFHGPSINCHSNQVVVTL